jgi:hypothetical protein
MPIDPTNPVVALCAAGMAVEGTPAEARTFFEQAWAARRDDYDACIAAHYLARHQPTASETLDWHTRAVGHAVAVTDGRADELLPSLYLNLADALAAQGRIVDACVAVRQAAAHLAQLPEGGYRDFVATGIRRLQARLLGATSGEPAIQGGSETDERYFESALRAQ